MFKKFLSWFGLVYRGFQHYEQITALAEAPNAPDPTTTNAGTYLRYYWPQVKLTLLEMKRATGEKGDQTIDNIVIGMENILIDREMQEMVHFLSSRGTTQRDASNSPEAETAI
jgi:hypothetical protein